MYLRQTFDKRKKNKKLKCRGKGRITSKESERHEIH